jgi:LmbE family N-acetylglucosaminyl deacetylase
MKTLVIAPHPDDEVLGVGGTLLRRKSEGAQIGWLIMTQMEEKPGLSVHDLKRRAGEIREITDFFGFDYVCELGFPTTKLDQVPVGKLVESVAKGINQFGPSEVFLPHYSDVHSDHRISFEVAISCLKWFRNLSVKRILAYETISETGFGLNPHLNFQPNLYVDIEDYLERKKEALKIYTTEIAEQPFPRSMKAVEALAHLRGSHSGFLAAEAFQILQERY